MADLRGYLTLSFVFTREGERHSVPIHDLWNNL